MTSPRICIICLLISLLGASRARAADTVETWDAGALDLDLYLGLDGLGSGSNDRTFSSEAMIGYGLFQRLSIYAGVNLEGNHDLSRRRPTVYLGLFGTPLQTDHVDLDLFVDLRAGGPELGELRLGPSLELNLDADAEMQTWGLYTRAGVPIMRRALTTAGCEAAEYQLALIVESTLGAYIHLARGHQLLLELDGALRPSPADDERRWELGGAALGYNVVLGESVELITQLYLDLPQTRGDGVTVGLMTGFILAVPR